MTLYTPMHATRMRMGLLLHLLWLAACAPDLADSHRSLEALCVALLDALQQQDRAAMEALMVTRNEHQRLLWNQLPSSQHFQFDYVRALNERNSRKAIDNALTNYGGADFEFVSIEFAEPSEQYDGFALHFGARLIVRRVSDGERGVLPILDVILEYDGRWKLMNYDE